MEFTRTFSAKKEVEEEVSFKICLELMVVYESIIFFCGIYWCNKFTILVNEVWLI